MIRKKGSDGRSIRYVIQCFCLCGAGLPKWRQAESSKGPLIYKYKGRAERTARDLTQTWEPDKFRVVKRIAKESK